MSFDKNRSAGYLANHMARLFASGLHSRIRAIGLAPAQFMVLLELWERDGMTQKELVVSLDVEQATMANTIARMERDGLVERRPHPRDGRAQIICATPKAHDLKHAAVSAARAQNETALRNLNADDAEQLLRLMQKVISAMQAPS